MDDTKKMLRVIINGQSAMKSELLTKIDGLGKKVDNLDVEVEKANRNLTKRIDKLGKQLAYLEDDAPTIDEFEKLEAKVDRIDRMVAPS